MLGVVFYRAGDDPLGRLIAWASGSRWTHVALYHEGEGALVEAVRSGVRRRPVEALRDAEDVAAVWLTGVDADDAERAWRWASARAGTRYGFLAAASIAVRQLTRVPLVVRGLDELICSELVALALMVAGRPPRNVVAATPGELAEDLGLAR